VKKISEVAKMFQMTPRTIRYYEEIGILSPLRSSTNIRLYPKRELVKLRLIDRGKRYGFSWEEIKEMILLFDKDRTGKKQLERSIQYGKERIADVDRQIDELLQIKQELEELLALFTEKLENMEGEIQDE